MTAAKCNVSGKTSQTTARYSGYQDIRATTDPDTAGAAPVATVCDSQGSTTVLPWRLQRGRGSSDGQKRVGTRGDVHRAQYAYYTTEGAPAGSWLVAMDVLDTL
jgi:hypothetical protein